ncbi:hypothetical protein [Legionella worsleiensis]|uniref:Transposase (ISmav2) n=1 Tax=Legionella worsleiensis TaxID=45076 RepID=A0A0W1A9J2_9GAMM|nr:hypothetical protein [Legionella worsleiensis]KTD78002.1 hypothetical protein Lwor_1884 [Legionella worsleiensis]STY31512.1 Uncharacterised protein [Legionella worsleiensis]
MSWLETEPMNEKIKFISAFLELECKCTFKDLCSRFNISCKTGYKYILKNVSHAAILKSIVASKGKRNIKCREISDGFPNTSLFVT